MKWLVLVSLLALVPLVPLRAGAAPADEHVPLRESFSELEIDLFAVNVGLDVGLVAFEKDLGSQRTPLIGAPPGFDRDVSDALYRGPGSGKWLGGVPDVFGGAIAPAAALAVYGGDALVFVARGRSLTGDANPDHAFLALAEAYAVAEGLTQSAKVFIGRERPRFALHRADAGTKDVDGDFSFFSGHSSSTFTLAAFISRDVGDWLVAGPLAGGGDGERLWLGRVLPGAVLYGTAGVVGLSRIIDQQHYLSDVLVGAAVGTVAGNLFYALHFDGLGRPLRRGGTTEITALPGGLAIRGAF